MSKTRVQIETAAKAAGTGMAGRTGTGATRLRLIAALAILPTIVIAGAFAPPAFATPDLYDAILEWSGPYFRVLHDPLVDQLVDSPPPGAGTVFSYPQGVAVREHGTGQRDVAYVVDTGNARVQVFEANGTRQTAHNGSFTWRSGGVTPAALEFDSDQILPAEWKVVADRWIIPFSESVEIDGTPWGRVVDLTGFTAADKVYTITYEDASNAPEIRFPASSLSRTTVFRLEYLVTDNQGLVADAFGIGDVDYGVSDGASKALLSIDGTSGGPASWQTVRGIAVSPQDAVATSDDIFLLDAADNSSGQNEELFYYTVSLAGSATYREAYDDLLTTPNGLAVARSGSSTAAALHVSGDNGPFDWKTGTVRDASQVTGHSYTVAVAGGNVTITDRTTGRILLDAAAFGSIADPYLGIPGLSLVKNPLVGTGITISTTRATAARFLFVADTGGNRVKVISAYGGTPTATDDWLPGDSHTSLVQPGGSIGGTADQDYYQSTPATVPPNWSAWTTTFPLAEGTLATLNFDPDGTPDPWTRTASLASAGPLDKVYAVDWERGRVLFGDGTHGKIPTASQQISFTYKTTPDVLRYGSLGTGSGEFTGPKGIATRWNASLGQFDVYVADTGVNRIQKFAFAPANSALNLPARMEYVCSWTTASGLTDLLSGPLAVAVAADGESPSRVWIAVGDTGNDRIVLYEDTAAASGGGSTAPAYLGTLGLAGTQLGRFGELNGLCFVQHGNDLDLYAADRTRGVVQKFERAEVPTIAFDLTGGSALPATFSPSGGYTFRFTTANPPVGGHIDLYYDTVGTWNAGTADRCLAADAVDADASTASWRFASSPGGAAAAGTNYYLYARMKDSDGTVVATTQTTASELLRLDPSLIPRAEAVDALDGDRTLYLQNGTSRIISLQVAYPESVMAVGFAGAFDTSLVEVTGITPGNGWDGTGSISQLFNPSYSNTTGTFRVNTSITGSPYGLSGNGPYTLARVALRAKANALKTTPVGSRSKTGTVTISKTTSGITVIDGSSPASWTTRSMTLQFGWLGDIATTGAGADSTTPHLMPNPDGLIDFADQMAFTMGWNGANFSQDPIADLGPVDGTAPNLVSNPDGHWNIDDIMAFTTMYSWAASLGFSKELGIDFANGPGADPGASAGAGAGAPGASSGFGNGGGPERLGNAWAHTVSRIEDPHGNGELVVDLLVENAIDLTGARFVLSFDPDQLDLQGVESGGLLEGSEGSLFLQRESLGVLDVAVTRLDRENPGIDGGGTAARATFRVRHPEGAPFTLAYDLRSSSGAVIGAGTWQAGIFTGKEAPFTLFPAWPNPARESTRILFSLDGDQRVSLQVFDAAGRRVRSLVEGTLSPGYHVVPFDGRDDSGWQLPSGVYFCRLGGEGRVATGRVVLAR